ncbi:MAG: MFS transporter [Planctomycetota bacterium]|nr:MAG: MFS transporter [Planctomycetota bacterium]
MSLPSRSPWAFLPTLYFAEGLPYVLVNTVSVVLCKRLGVRNEEIGLYTSLISFPWILKMLWGPLVDLTLTKRRWIVVTQLGIAAMLLLAPLTLGAQRFLAPFLLVFTAVAFLSATHDVACDGFYMQALSQKQQAGFVGVRTTCYRLAVIFGSGALVALAGSFETAQGSRRSLAWSFLSENPLARAWAAALAAGAIAYSACALINAFVMPHPAEQRQAGRPRDSAPFFAALGAFFRQKRLWAILAFILLYRCGESLIAKMSVPFLLDTRAPAYEGSFTPPGGEPVHARGTLVEDAGGGTLRLEVIEPPELAGAPWSAPAAALKRISDGGGLQISTTANGIITGTVGIIALVLGGLLGGAAIARFGLRRCFWPMVLCLNLPNLLYVWAAHAQPGTAAVGALVAVDQFGYGFGFTAYLVYLMLISQSTPYAASTYAIATGLMALGVLGAGILSGYLQAWLGYPEFFLAVCFLGLPGVLSLLWIPLPEPSGAGAKPAR